MDKRYTTIENVIFLKLSDEQVIWQQDFAHQLQQEKHQKRTLQERMERRRMERQLDKMYEEIYP